MLSGIKRVKGGEKDLALFYCQFFLPHLGRCTFPNLRWGEGEKKILSDLREGSSWEEQGRGNVNQEAPASKLDTTKLMYCLFLCMQLHLGFAPLDHCKQPILKQKRRRP